MSKPIVFSYGGGRQTAAICVAIKRGLLPKPDKIVMADTGRERASTWEYLHNVITPFLAPLGLTVEIASHDLASKDLYGGADGETLLIPAYTKTGKLSIYCSGEWKRDVVNRYLRGQGIKDRVQWLGYSLDEMKRVHYSRLGYIEHVFPLIDLRWRISDCMRAVEEEGLPLPPKSACFICPNWNAKQWAEMRDTAPADFEKACQIDDEARARDSMGGVFLYEGRVPLREANFEADMEDETKQGSLLGCAGGSCWT